VNISSKILPFRPPGVASDPDALAEEIIKNLEANMESCK
jgi:hypothetical protein